jgi:LacI family transcriptional regulator
MAIRLKDIAEDLKLSVVTISKVLRDHPDISVETRDRVLKRIKELNYRPNLTARALVTGRTFAVGLVVPDLVHPFFGQVARALSSVLRVKGFSLVLASSEDEPELEQQEIEQLVARRVDVLIVASTQRAAESFRSLDRQSVPYVLIDRRFDDLPAHFVGVNDVQVGKIATEHIVSVGCRHIAYIGGPDISTSLGRLQGYRETLRAKGMAARDEYVIMRERGDDAGEASGYAAAKQLLRRHPIPDGIFCINDPTAMGAMKAVIEAGLQVPDDVAIMGCGNVTYSDFLRVPLTSVDQQSDKIGQRAGRLALSLLDERPVRAKQVLLEPTVIERASTKRSKSRPRKP